MLRRTLYTVRVLATALVFVAIVRSASAAVVAHYSFDEASGTSVADNSGNGNNGVLDVNGGSGALGAAGQFGNAVSLAGGSWVEATNTTFSSIEMSDWTVAAWVTATASYSDSLVIGEFSAPFPPNTGSRWRPMNPYLDGNVHMFSTFRNTTGTQDIVVSDVANQIPNNGTTWTHLAVTWDRAAKTFKSYVNGTLIDTQVSGLSNVDLLPFNTTLQIGRKGLTTNPAQFWEGRIDEIWVLNSALSGGQVNSLMALNVVPEPSSGMLLWIGVIGFLRRRRRN